MAFCGLWYSYVGALLGQHIQQVEPGLEAPYACPAVLTQTNLPPPAPATRPLQLLAPKYFLKWKQRHQLKYRFTLTGLEVRLGRGWGLGGMFLAGWRGLPGALVLSWGQMPSSLAPSPALSLH